MANISQNDIESLAQKLSHFTQGLTPGEQAALATVVMRGVSQSDDVKGYTVGPDDGSEADEDDFNPVITVVRPFFPPTLA